MFSWGESCPLILWTCPTVRPFDSTYISTDKSDFHNIHTEISTIRRFMLGSAFCGACPTVPAFYPCRTPLTRVQHCSIFRNNAHYAARTCSYKRDRGREPSSDIVPLPGLFEILGVMWVSGIFYDVPEFITRLLPQLHRSSSASPIGCSQALGFSSFGRSPQNVG